MGKLSKMSESGSASRPFRVTLEYKSGLTRTVTVIASSREVAERRALKRNPAAVGVKPIV